MVEKYSKNVTRRIAEEYLNGIERLDNEEYRERIEGFLLKAAAVHLNELGHKYSSIETEEGQKIPVRPDTNEEEGDVLTLNGLKELADI